MSELVKKAMVFEEKGKWSNAAKSYLQAAREAVETNQTKDAKNLFLKAIAASEKTEDNLLLVESVFAYEKIATKAEKKEVLPKALPAVKSLLALALTKKKNLLAFEYLEKKELISRSTGVDLEETLREKGEVSRRLALKMVISKKVEERERGFAFLKEAAKCFLEINAIKEKFKGDFQAFQLLMEKGFIKEGFSLFEKLISFCETNQLAEEATTVLQQIITYANAILNGKGSKKLVKALQATFSSADPGGELLKIGIEKAQEIGANEVIVAAATIQVEQGNLQFNKKKFDIAKRLYEKALLLLTTIQAVDTAKNVFKQIATKAYTLLDTKGKFQLALDYFAMLQIMEELDKGFLADFFVEKGANMFQRDLITLALEDYKSACRVYLSGQLTVKFEKTVSIIFEKSLELIAHADFQNALIYSHDAISILLKVEKFENIGEQASKIAHALLENNQLPEAEDFVKIAFDNFLKAGKTVEAATTYKTMGESFLALERFETGAGYLIQAAKTYRSAEAEDKIMQTAKPLLKAAIDQLIDGNADLAQSLNLKAIECAKEKGPLAQVEVLQEFNTQAMISNQPKLVLNNIQLATKIVGANFPAEKRALAEKAISYGQQLIISNQQFKLGTDFITHAVLTLAELGDSTQSSQIIFEIGSLLFENKQPELAKGLLQLITQVLKTEENPEVFGTNVANVAKLLIENRFVDDGIDLLRKSVGSYLNVGGVEPVIKLARYCALKAQENMAAGDVVFAKHLFIAAMEFSTLVDLEVQSEILTSATNAFLEIGDFYTINEFYDFAKANLEGEKDYLGKVGRLQIFQGSTLRDQKGLVDEASEFIHNGIATLKEVDMIAEAGEVALNQGKAFIEKGNFVYGEELIETAAQIFIQLNDIERSGDAFLSLAEINMQKSQWQDAFQQIELANKSYSQTNLDKLASTIIITADIGQKALINKPAENKEFALQCFDRAIQLANEHKLFASEVDVTLLEGRAFATIKDHQTAYNFFLQLANLLEEKDETEKSPLIAEELTTFATIFIADNEVELGLQLVDLATAIYLRLGQPINASETYMKACNALLKMNKIVQGVKLVLLASDTLMVANEYKHAVRILTEIVDFLYDLKDYQNAAIVAGQIVTVHQKTGEVEEQKKVINRLVEKAIEVINEGRIMEGEQLWEQAANFSISVDLDYALQINDQRIENLLNAGMYNSTNNAFKQFLPILEEDKEKLLSQVVKIAEITDDLFAKEEFKLAKDFVFTAVDYYLKAEEFDQVITFCLDVGQRFIVANEETSGIELIDKAAFIANDSLGAHEAAKIYLRTGFLLVEKDYNESGFLAINKAVDIELQTQNMEGCNELGEIAIEKANELINHNIPLAIKIYEQASQIFQKASNFIKAGEVQTTILNAFLSLGDAVGAIKACEQAVDYYLKGKNSELAATAARQIIESSRRFFDENDFPKAVLILERGRFLVEKTTRYDLLDLIVSIYMNAANQNLPNRKSAIGVFFLKRAIAIAESSPDPEEIKKVVNLSLTIALETIKKKNSLAGAKVLEMISRLEISKNALLSQLTATLLDALKLTLETEWNMIGKVLRDAFHFFKGANQDEAIKELISILTKRANADLLLNKPQLGFFFLEHAIRIVNESGDKELMFYLGNDLLEQFLVLHEEVTFDSLYRLLGYCYQIFQQIQDLESITRVGAEFAKLGSKDLINNMQSIRGYESLLTARDIASQTQNSALMKAVVLALLDFAIQQSAKNANSVLSTLEDIVQGLKEFEIPKSTSVAIDYASLQSYLKTLTSFGNKVSKNDKTFKLGKKIIQNCSRLLALTGNHLELEKDLADVKKNMQKLCRRGNQEAAYKLREAAIVFIDLNETNQAIKIAEDAFAASQQLLERKKYLDSVEFAKVSLVVNQKLDITSELKNIGLFAYSSGDRLINEGKILEAMDFYDIAIEAFDLSNDDENSNRLINKIVQTREWDANKMVAFQVYKIASESAIRMKNWQKAHEIANKCYNRGIAFIDQPRVPTEISLKFITLAGRIFEDIGAIKDAANSYDSAILKFIRLMRTRKNIESIITELLVKTGINRMAGCDMDSLETIFLRVMELAEMKKSKYTKIISRVLKLINSSKVGQAWDLMVSLPYVSHGRIRKIIGTTKRRIIYDLQSKGTFDRTVLSTTDRSLPLSDYLIENLLISRKIDGQSINKDVFISATKIKAIRSYFYNEYELWGRVDLEALTKEFGVLPTDAASIVRREFLPTIYMAVLDTEQKVFYSFDRLKAEISLILGRERKKNAHFDPMQVASEMHVPPDIIKEVLREISCDEVVENAPTM